MCIRDRNGNEYFADIVSIVNELPDGYEYGGKLTEEQIKYAYINGTEYYLDKHKENLYDFYVYQECGTPVDLSLIHISEPTRLGMISYAVFCLKKKKK